MSNRLRKLTNRVDDENQSAAIRLLTMVYGNSNDAIPHSYERLNHAMRHALELAIGAGFAFREGDVRYILDNYNSSYWLGYSDEWIYRDAIVVGNMSAIKSYEAAKGRHGFIADDVTPPKGYGSYSSYVHLVGERKRERLAVGFTFHYRGLTLTVNSFATDSSYVNSASYKRIRDGEYYKDKLDKRFKLTRDDIIAERAERKEREMLLYNLTKLAESNGQGDTIRKSLGAKTRADYARLPIEKIRKVAAKYGVTDSDKKEKKLVTQ